MKHLNCRMIVSWRPLIRKAEYVLLNYKETKAKSVKLSALLCVQKTFDVLHNPPNGCY